MSVLFRYPWRGWLQRGLLVLVAVGVLTLLMGAAKKPTTAKKKPKKKTTTTVAHKDPATTAAARKEPARHHFSRKIAGRPWYEAMLGDGRFRIAVFWGWDHPREVIEAVFPAFRALHGKNIYFGGHRARIEIGLLTQVSDRPKEAFRAALEDPTIDVVIYSGHARYGGGMAFAERDDIFRSGNGEMIEDRHTVPYRYSRATAEDLEATEFPKQYKIVLLNCCDSEAHFRESWTRRIRECGAIIDLATIEFPVFNLYDHRRVLGLLQDLLTFQSWQSIKEHYDAEIHKRPNFLVVRPVFTPDDQAAAPIPRIALPSDEPRDPQATPGPAIAPTPAPANREVPPEAIPAPAVEAAEPVAALPSASEGAVDETEVRTGSSPDVCLGHPEETQAPIVTPLPLDGDADAALPLD